MYNLVLTDRSYKPQADLKNVQALTFFRGLSKLATCSFNVRVDNPQVNRLAACDGFIKVYRRGALVFVGPIISAEETGQREAQSVAINCADAGWILSRRIGGIGPNGDMWTTATSRSTIAKTLIDNQNTGVGETGISTTTYTLSSGSAITYKFGPYANALSGIQELGGALDGFDWVMRPIENWVNGALSGSKVAGFQASTVIGVTQNAAVFEYGAGTRTNVLGYSITTTRDQQANKVYHVGADASDVKTGVNNPAITTWGVLSDVVSSDVTDATMRQKLVDEHAAVRGYPRTIIKMTPHIDPGDLGHVPEPFVDYDVGDIVPFRAIAAGTVRFSGLVRVYGITATMEDSGFERIELTLEDES